MEDYKTRTVARGKVQGVVIGLPRPIPADDRLNRSCVIMERGQAAGDQEEHW